MNPFRADETEQPHANGVGVKPREERVEAAVM